SGATNWTPIGGVVTIGTADGGAAGCPSFPGRVATTKTPTATTAATATAIAPIFRFRAVRRCFSSCFFHESRSGSVCFVTISKTSLSSSIWASSVPEHGSALRGQRADGRRTDAHDPCGLLGAVAVQVEQDEGGPLTRRDAPEHREDVFADV